MTSRSSWLGLLALTVFVGSTAAPAFAQPIITGRVVDADDGATAQGLPWRQLVLGPTFSCATLSAVGDEIGLVRSDGFWGPVDVTCSGPGAQLAVVAEGEYGHPTPPRLRAGYFALTVSAPGAQSSPHDFPATQLAPIPVPVATAGCDDVVVTWAHALACNELVLEDRGLGAYAIMRSPAGSDAFVEVGRTAGADGFTEWIDAGVPPGDWVYALKLVFGNPAAGVESLHLSANSDPVTIAPPGSGEDVDTRLREPGGTSLELDWRAVSASASATAHHVYAGDISDIADPATFVLRDRIACGLPIGPGTITVLDPSGGAGTSRYYVLSVVTADCTEYYGTDSFGVERPASASACP